MTKFRSLVFFSLFLFLFLNSLRFYKSRNFDTARAQENIPVKIKSEAVEFVINEIYIPCEDSTSNLCTPYPSDITSHPDPTNQDHEFGLVINDGFSLPPNTDIYIVGCINTNKGVRCTTGDPSLDSFLNNFPGGDIMNPDPTHQFSTLQNPIKTSADGSLGKVIVRSFTPQTTSHLFNGYYIIEENITPTSSLNSIESLEGMKQSTFNFTTVAPSPTRRPQNIKSQNEGENKRMIANDPKGRFFDSQSLEPIPEGEIALLNNLKKLFIYRNLVNPQSVKINGEFNFWVPNGIYYFNITKNPANHNWPVQINQVDKNYVKAYYCDPEVKDEKNQSAPLYLQQYPIVEFNKLIHCDIPFDPGTSTPFRGDVKTVNFGVFKTKKNTETVYTGKVTHPLTVITLKGESTEKNVATTTADKLGYWEITINNNNYPIKTDGSPDRLIAFYKKVDLTNINQTYPLLIGQVFEPLLIYIEGYAYDETGKILPRARVGYRQNGTERTIYVTTTDDNGFFRIPTRYLPSFDYELVFTPPNSTKTIVHTTSNFIQMNNQYLKNKNLNLMTQINNEPLNSKAMEKIKNLSDLNSLNKNKLSLQSKQSLSNQNQTSKQILLIIIIIFGSLIGLIFFAIVLFKKQKTQLS